MKKLKIILLAILIFVTMSGFIYLISVKIKASNGSDEGVPKTQGGSPMYFAGTPFYIAKSSTFQFDAEQARSIAEKELGVSAVGIHYLIVDNEYVFSGMHKFGIKLSGIYVDGRTGHVRRRNSLEIVKWNDHRDWLELMKSTNRETRQIQP